MKKRGSREILSLLKTQDLRLSDRFLGSYYVSLPARFSLGFFSFSIVDPHDNGQNPRKNAADDRCLPPPCRLGKSDQKAGYNQKRAKDGFRLADTDQVSLHPGRDIYNPNHT